MSQTRTWPSNMIIEQNDGEMMVLDEGGRKYCLTFQGPMGDECVVPFTHVEYDERKVHLKATVGDRRRTTTTLQLTRMDNPVVNWLVENGHERDHLRSV